MPGIKAGEGIRIRKLWNTLNNGILIQIHICPLVGLFFLEFSRRILLEFII